MRSDPDATCVRTAYVCDTAAAPLSAGRQRAPAVLKPYEKDSSAMSIPASSRARISVGDAMHTGILMTDADTPLPLVARLMSDRRVHVVAIAEDGQMRRPLKMVTALDVAAAVAASAEMTAGQAAQTEMRVIRSDASLEEAARLMVADGTEHLLVIDPGSAHAEGILSALDVAAVFGR
jgi:CBS domain-containing protein